VSQGTKLRQFPKEVLVAAFKSAEQVYAELSDTNPAWKKIYTDYAAYRREANLWFRFNEAAIDSFMQSQKL
jgi:TRAP-type mannitol/chloroaromatic compound transport system substrate-binding protein